MTSSVSGNSAHRSYFYISIFNCNILSADVQGSLSLSAWRLRLRASEDVIWSTAWTGCLEVSSASAGGLPRAWQDSEAMTV
jgi:hypothetical protein